MDDVEAMSTERTLHLGNGPREGETLDSICSVTILQRKQGYRFNLDPILLAHFAGESARGSGPVLDAGTGSGVIALLLAKKFQKSQVVGLELQRSLFELAVRNVRLNGAEEEVSVVHGDLRKIERYFPPKSFRWVVTNPPYRIAEKGRTNPDPERAVARHELGAKLGDIVQTARYLLREQGSFFAVYPAARLSQMMCGLDAAKLSPKRLRMIHPREGQPAKLMLLEAQKSSRAELKIEPPLFLHPAHGSQYTAEVRAMLE
jgi:tRNA1Val (adenine37-N6)-methyltransferase